MCSGLVIKRYRMSLHLTHFYQLVNGFSVFWYQQHEMCIPLSVTHSHDLSKQAAYSARWMCVALRNVLKSETIGRLYLSNQFSNASSFICMPFCFFFLWLCSTSWPQFNNWNRCQGSKMWSQRNWKSEQNSSMAKRATEKRRTKKQNRIKSNQLN